MSTSVPETANDLYPPGIPFEQIRASKYLEQELRQRAQSSEQLAQIKANEKINIVKFVKSPLGIAIIVFFFVLLIIYIANPPFTQTSKDSPLEEGSPSLLKAVITAAIFGLFAFFGPMVYRKLTAMSSPTQ